MKIKAAVCPSAKSQFQIEDLEMRDPLPDEVRVRIVATGICRTDVVVQDQIMNFPLPGVLGHEGAGIVEYVGPNVKKKIEIGDHVVLSTAHCGVCNNCESGHPSYCIHFYDLNLSGKQDPPNSPELLKDERGGVVHSRFFGQSSFASYATVKERNIVVIRKDVPIELMGPLGCGFQTGAGTVMNVLKPPPDTSIMVFGAGAVGLAGVMAAKAMGCGIIIVSDGNDDRLQTAQKLGATHVINSKKENAVATARQIMKQYMPRDTPDDGLGVAFSLDSTGSVSASQEAMEVLAYCGTCAVVGSSSDTAQIQVPARRLLMGLNMRGATEGDSVPDIFLPRLVDLWKKGLFPFDTLVKFYPFEQINQAFEDFSNGKVIKPIIRQPEPHKQKA